MNKDTFTIICSFLKVKELLILSQSNKDYQHIIKTFLKQNHIIIFRCTKNEKCHAYFDRKRQCTKENCNVVKMESEMLRCNSCQMMTLAYHDHRYCEKYICSPTPSDKKQLFFLNNINWNRWVEWLGKGWFCSLEHWNNENHYSQGGVNPYVYKYGLHTASRRGSGGRLWGCVTDEDFWRFDLDIYYEHLTERHSANSLEIVESIEFLKREIHTCPYEVLR